MAASDPDFYQAHKDDPTEWGDPRPAPRSSRRRLAAMISVRFLPDEERAVRDAAAAKGLSVSWFIRQATLGRVAPPRAYLPAAVSRTRGSGVAVCWDSGRVDGGTFAGVKRA